MQGTLILNVI